MKLFEEHIGLPLTADEAKIIAAMLRRSLRANHIGMDYGCDEIRQATERVIGKLDEALRKRTAK